MEARRLSTIFIVVFVDLLGFSLILPLLPYYAEAFGATPATVGFLVASYAAAQLIGAPLLGRLSDRYGRRPVLMLSISGTFGGFLLLGFAPELGSLLAGRFIPASTGTLTLALLFGSRLIDGLTGGNLSVAQAYITDITDSTNRARGLGLIGAAFGLGFIIGPAVGGTLSVWGYALPALVAAGLSLLNLVGVFAWLPESLGESQRAAAIARPRVPFSLTALLQALQRPRVGPLLNIRLLFGLAFSMFQTIFALYAQTRLELNAQQTGYVLAYVGVLAVIVQGFGVGWLTSHLPDNPLVVIALAIMTLSLLGWAITPSLGALLIVLAPLAVSGGTLNTVISSALTKAVPPEDAGGTLGLAASLESLTRVIAPSLGGVLLGQLGAWAPGIFSALVLAWAVVYAWRRLILRPDSPPSAIIGTATAGVGPLDIRPLTGD
jgi:DHA1 family tetracycline resistance protein-like MFS transporter